jgi:molecular chaperone GrpE (heat shock protein)
MSRLWRALLNRPEARSAPAASRVDPSAKPAAPAVTDSTPIEALRAEYERLQRESARGIEIAANRALERLFADMAPVLAQLARLEALRRAGRSLDAGDILALVGDMEGKMAGHGLTRVGEPLQSVPFEAARHTIVAGRPPREGTPVELRAPGYMFHDATLLRADAAPLD